ncbi:MAG TPA: anaerobic ribonucleoside-triphosphate reductase [Spirochaetales bacterium]|nr:anaerobic ribonucleoside-triphosphate reductase [Spirochaetales bacterium]
MEQRKMKEQKLAELKASLLSVEGRPTEVYSRIVGYYRSVRNWNAGKREEFRHRAEYAFPQWNARAQASLSGMNAQAQNGPVEAKAAGASQPSQKARASGYILFVRRSCPNCPPVKEYLGSSKLAGALMDTDTEAGLDMARQYEVLATPTAILLDDNGKELSRCYTKAQLMAELAPLAREAVLA